MNETNVGLSALPAGWVWTTLEEISEINLGQSPPSSTYNTDGKGLPFYQGKLEFGKTYPTPRKWCTAPKKIAEKGDVFISVRAPVGPTNICPEKSCVGRGLAAIRGLCGIQPFFILYLMRTFEYEIAGKGMGTTFNAIKGDQLKTFEIPLPPLPEQNRIVAKIEELFTKLNAGKEELLQAKARLKRYRQSVLKAAMEGRLTEDWRKKHRDEIEPASILLERILQERWEKWEAEQLAQMKAKGKMPKDDKWKNKYKESPGPDTSKLSELPERWVWTNVQQLSKVSGGLTKNSKRNIYPKKLPYLRVANVYADELRLEEIKYIGVKEEELDRVLLKDGDMLVVEGNGSPDQIGRVAIWDGSISPCAHQNHIIKARFDPVEIGMYCIYWLLSIEGRKYISQVASSTSGLYTLSISKVQALPVPIPPLREQQVIIEEIDRHLSVADAVEETLDAELKRSDALRQSILKQAFSGKLVPQDPTDEPAEKLLERIKEGKMERETKQKSKRKPKKTKKREQGFTKIDDLLVHRGRRDSPYRLRGLPV